MVMRVQTVVFWVVTLCTLGGGYQRFGGIHFFHLQCGRKMEAVCFSKNIGNHI
jgi:hypothetical protein